MNDFAEIQPKDIARLDLALLANVLKVLQELTLSAYSDIYSDTPECQQRVEQVQTAIQEAFDALIQIQEALDATPTTFQNQEKANRILDEAEEAFTVKSMAEERAANGNWPIPSSVPDYLFWIEDEALVQESQLQDEDNPIYMRALHDLAQELRGLGFTPSPPPWEVLAVTEEVVP